jgi:hypothetical protein
MIHIKVKEFWEKQNCKITYENNWYWADELTQKWFQHIATQNEERIVYWFNNKWYNEEQMLKVIKLKIFA